MLKDVALLSLSLVFPGAHRDQIALKTLDPGANLTVLYQSALLDDVGGKLWAETLPPVVDRAYSAYASLMSLRALPQCEAPPSARPPLTIVLLDTLAPDAKGLFSDVTERRGYTHPENPGPLIQASPWNAEAIRQLLAHEAFHVWCGAEASQGESLWLEEGAADLVAFLTQNALPQLNITRYFRGQAPRSPYGSSFLWWIAALEVTRSAKPETFLEALARLHLGLRSDLVYGSLFDRSVNDSGEAAAFPHGELSPNPSNEQGAASLPYYRRPWGQVTLVKPAPDAKPEAYFVWHGPLYSGNADQSP